MQVSSSFLASNSRRVLQCSASAFVLALALSGSHGVAADLNVPAGGSYDLGGGQESYDQVTVGSGGTVTSTAGAILTANQGAVAGGLAGGMQLTKESLGTLLLSGGSSYGGGTVIRNGIVSVTADGALGANVVQFDNLGVSGALPILALANGLTVANPLWLDGTGGTVDVSAGTATLTGNIATNDGLGGAGLTKTGAGELVLVGGGGAAWTLYQGDTVINGGTLTLSGGDEFTNRLGIGTIRINGTTLRTAANTVATVGNETVLANGGIFDVRDDASLTLENGIAGTGDLTKTGAGSLSISGLNIPSTFTGNTYIQGGRLFVSSGGLPSGTVVSTSGADDQLVLRADL